MKIPIFLQKIHNRITKARFWFVTVDVCPDFRTGQSEMCSYVVKAPDEQTARNNAQLTAMNDWDVDCTCVYIVDCTETTDPDLIYDK